MRSCGPLLALLMTATSWSVASAVAIYDDPGGQIAPYLAKYRALRASGDKVVIDGRCASACTMVLGIIPRSRICVTARAILVFHTAWDPSPSGAHIPNSAGNKILWSKYPSDIRRWIDRHGGLGSQVIYLRGEELTAILPRCR